LNKKVIRDGFFGRIKLSKKFKKGINIMDQLILLHLHLIRKNIST